MERLLVMDAKKAENQLFVGSLNRKLIMQLRNEGTLGSDGS